MWSVITLQFLVPSKHSVFDCGGACMYECSVFDILEVLCLRWREAAWIVDQEVYSYIEPMLMKYDFLMKAL